jgi:outer membrane lipoprotein
MNIITVFLGFVVLLQGCTYAISPAVTDRADKTITFEMLRSNPDVHKGKLLILGGTIAQVTVVKQGSLIAIDQKPLDFWNKPTRTSNTGGRFLVFYPRAVDPLTYSFGREITVAAEVAGTKLKFLGDVEYDYPVLVSKEFKLWPKEQKRPEAQTQWGDPLYAPQRQPY